MNCVRTYKNIADIAVMVYFSPPPARCKISRVASITPSEDFIRKVNPQVKKVPREILPRCRTGGKNTPSGVFLLR